MILWRWKTFAFWKITDFAWKKLSRFDDLEFPKAGRNFPKMTEKRKKSMPAKVPALRGSGVGVKIEKPYGILMKERGHIKATPFFYFA